MSASSTNWDFRERVGAKSVRGSRFEVRGSGFEVPDRRKLDRDFYTDIRDAASSIPNNIAEGHVRFSPTDNRRFLTFARASLGETQNRLMEGRERNCWNDAAFHKAWRLSTRAEAAIAGLMRYLLTDRAKRNAEEIKRKMKEADRETRPDEPTNPK